MWFLVDLRYTIIPYTFVIALKTNGDLWYTTSLIILPVLLFCNINIASNGIVF